MNIHTLPQSFKNRMDESGTVDGTKNNKNQRFLNT